MPRFDRTIAEAILRVGAGGRGFVIHHRCEVEPFRGRRIFLDRRFVVTAAHCLARLPPAHGASYWSERTYQNLLGALSKPQGVIAAECAFVDPVADIAVLCGPDNEQLAQDRDAYEALTGGAALRIARRPRGGRAWSLGLDGRWFSWKANFVSDDRVLYMSANLKNEGGMSGSPIFADDESVIGLLAVGGESGSVGSGETNADLSGPQPVLADHLPGWILRGAQGSR